MKPKNLRLSFFQNMKKLYSLLFAVALSIQVLPAQNKQQVATAWLQSQFNNLKSQQAFRVNFSHKGPSGETFRFAHTVNGIEVWGSSVAVHVSPKNTVTYHSTTYEDDIETIDTTPSLSASDALNYAKGALQIDEIIQSETKLYVYQLQDATTLIYRVTTVSSELPGYWETLVDAKSGSIISMKDISVYEKSTRPKNTGVKHTVLRESRTGAPFVVLTDGTAMVYDPDPLTKTLSTYGGDYVDNNDNTNAALDAARTAVTLLGIEFDGVNYRLRGPYAEIAELQAPSTGLFLQPSSDFSFTRDAQGFEAANVYYHLDKSIRYVNVDLGIPCVSLFNNGVVRYDPHAFNGADNSSYGGGNLNFGEGGVDDAEDMDVILHELGHGLHDWITNGNLSQVNGLSEGCGDYWANSYKRSLGYWQETDQQYYWVFGWDGHNPFWSGRITNYGATYPGGLTGAIHTDGQIWASVLMEIWELIGKDKLDTAFLEGLAMTNSGTNQQQAAIAVRQAAIDMGYSCDDINAMTDRFEARGYLLPTYICDPEPCGVTSIAVSNISACDDNGTPNDSSDDFFTADVTVTFENAPSSGTLEISGDGVASVSASGLPSPYTFVGVVFAADGSAIDLTAAFSDEVDCTMNEPNAGTAPESCSTLGVTDQTVSEVVIYPNPAESTIVVGNLKDLVNVTIYNLLGQRILERTIGPNTNTVDVSNLAMGTYLVRVNHQVIRLVIKY